MTSDSIARLNEKHSQLCARAHALNIDLPEELTAEFDSEETGRTVCSNIDALIRAAQAKNGLAEDTGTVHKDPVKRKTPKATKPRASKPTDTNDVGGATDEENTMRKTAKTAKKTVAKKAKKASKANARKPAGKKAATKPRAKSGDTLTAKVGTLLKKGTTRAEILKATGWKAVSVQQMATSLGLKLKVDESVRPFKYKAA